MTQSERQWSAGQGFAAQTEDCVWIPGAHINGRQCGGMSVSPLPEG